MSNEMKFKFEADIANLQAGLDKMKSEFGKLGNEGAKLGNKLKGDLTKGANSAGQSLTNLGRIAQDAPFGFIGIQNNLNPLLEGFQRLKAETGSTGNALKALASSLTGAGGLGLALSLVGGAVLLYQKYFAGASKATKELSDASKSAADGLQSIIAGLAEEKVKVDLLVEALKNENITRKQREEAITQLKKISPEYFSNLNTEKATIDQITLAYGAYTASILRNIEAKSREKELIDVTQKILQLQLKGQSLGERQVLINGKLQTVNSQRLITEEEINNSANNYQKFMAGTLGLTKQENIELNKLKLTQSELLKLTAQNKGLGFLDKVDTAKLTKAKETIADVIAELDRELGFLTVKRDVFGGNEAPAKMAAIFSAVERLIKDFKVNPDDTIIKKLFGEQYNDLFGKLLGDSVQNIDDLKLRTEVKEKLAAIVPTTLTDVTVPLNPNVTIPNPGKLAKQISLQLDGIIEGVSADVAASLGDSLGQALAGGADSFADFFKPIFLALAAGVKQLGTSIIAASVLIDKARKIAFKSPALGIAAGIALIALGSLIQSKLNVRGFANGGNTTGGLALVGERGPELVNLPAGSRVTPNHLSDINGGMHVEVGGRFEIRGYDLIALVDKAVQSRLRHG